MNTWWKVIFWLLILFFILHIIRDILQIYHINTFIANVWKTNHYWCRPNCDYVTFPPQIFGLLGSIIVLRRNKVGILGWLVIATLPFWPIAFLMQ